MTTIRSRNLALDPARHSSAGALILSALLLAMSVACTAESSGSASPAQPWGTDAVAPAEFAKELAGASDAAKPTVVCTAPAFMFRTAHIPGAVFHGPASSPEGLASLKAWAEPLPRGTDIVIYCGCCPLNVCPNLRPAYATLKGLGFTRVRVLLLAENFKIDWVDRGYPYER